MLLGLGGRLQTGEARQTRERAPSYVMCVCVCV